MSDNTVIDDQGNGGLNYESAVDSILDGLEEITTNGNSIDHNPPKVEKKAEPEVSEEDAVEDDDESILAGLEDESEEADDEPEGKSEEEEEDQPEEEGDDQEITVKVDGEELTVSLAELKKGYGLNKSLTQKGQQLAEERKKLDEEAKAVAWVKAKPELKQLQEQIEEANEAINRGFVLEDGQPVYLTKEQIAQTRQNVEEAIANYHSKNTPPMLDELQTKVPEMFSQDETVRQAKLDSFAETLRSTGYSQPEIQAMDDPRVFLMLQELTELRELQSKVNKAKARRSEKTSKVVSNVPKAKAQKPATGKSQKPTRSLSDLQQAINDGTASAADLFDDFV